MSSTADHRGSKRLARVVVGLRHLEALGVEAVHNPAVLRELTRPLDDDRGQPRQRESRAEAEATIQKYPYTADRLRAAD